MFPAGLQQHFVLSVQKYLLCSLNKIKLLQNPLLVLLFITMTHYIICRERIPFIIKNGAHAGLPLTNV